MLLATSCSQEELVSNPAGDGNVNISVSLPKAMGTRAFADGLSATRLQVAVYDATTENLVTSQDYSFDPASLSTTISLSLAQGRAYKIAFFASPAAGDVYTLDTDAKTISVDYTKMTAYNSNDYDCFYKLEDIPTVTGPVTRSVTLTRPVAQINWGTNDLDEGAVIADDNYGAGAAKLVSKMTAKAYSTFNLFTSDVDADSQVDVEFPYLARPAATEAFPVEDYDYVSMQYLLVPQESSVVDLKLEATNDATGAVQSTVLVTNAPVQANYRTNIYGALLTTPSNFTVTKDKNFLSPDYNNEVKVDTPEGFTAALADTRIEKIEVTKSIDLSDATDDELTFYTPKRIELADDAQITLATEKCLTAKDGLVLTGGTISNEPTTRSAAESEAYKHKSLIHITGGDLVVDGVTLINDPNHHYHGNTYNSAAIAYWNDVNVTITNSRIISGMFTICGMGRNVASGEIILTDCYLESSSSYYDNKSNWAYAARIFGSKAELNNCEVKGIQGALSLECDATINGGKYYTYNSEGYTDAYYAVQLTNNARLTINGGEFYAPNNRSGEDIGGTSCIAGNDNDVNLPVGRVVAITGGKFSGKPYVTEKIDGVKTTEVFSLEGSDYQYFAIDGDDQYKWEVKKAE